MTPSHARLSKYPASTVVSALVPLVGPAAIGLVVFGVALTVVSMRAKPPMNNVPAYFLGLITWFAAHTTPTFDSFVGLVAVAALGIGAAWLAHLWQTRIAGLHPAT